MNPGRRRGRPKEGLSIIWADFRDDFIKYAKSRYNLRNARCLISYLDRYVRSPIKCPMDVVNLFSGLSNGQQHHLNRALRALFKFLEVMGYDETWLDSLRKGIPRDRVGIDLKVPEAGEILDSLKRLSKMALKYRALWNLCLDSGLRLVEAIEVISGFNESRLTKLKGFNRYEVSSFRGSKQAYYAYFTTETLNLIQKVAGEPLIPQNASHYYMKYGFTAPKYLRKFAFSKMIELGVPESVADFIEGRVPKRIGAKHYMILVKQADWFYPRYAEYVNGLRQKASLI